MKDPVSLAKSILLVVDDDRDVRDALRGVLQDAGYLVLTANNGREALDVLDTVARPDLAIVDLMMPVMDGCQFAAELRKRDAWRDIPVIVITAKDLTAEDRRALSGEVQGMMQKGAFNRDDLLREMHHLMGRSPAGPQHTR